jgi:uridine phosphorylase
MLRSYLIDEVSNQWKMKHKLIGIFAKKPYVIVCSEKLEKSNRKRKCNKGITATVEVLRTSQGRVLRLNIQDENLNSKMDNFKFEENRITNLEMETAAYGLRHLGHNALSQCYYR